MTTDNKQAGVFGKSWNNIGLAIIGTLVTIIGIGALTMLGNITNSVKATDNTMKKNAVQAIARDSIFTIKLDSLKGIIQLQDTNDKVSNIKFENLERRVELLEKK